MNQQSHDAERLKIERLLRQKAQEQRELEERLKLLNQARSSSSTLDNNTSQGDYQITSRPSLNDNGRSRSNTIPRSAAGAVTAADFSIKTEQTVRIPAQ